MWTHPKSQKKIKRQAFHGISSSLVTWWSLNGSSSIKWTQLNRNVSYASVSCESLIEDETPNPMITPKFAYLYMKSSCLYLTIVDWSNLIRYNWLKIWGSWRGESKEINGPNFFKFKVWYLVILIEFWAEISWGWSSFYAIHPPSNWLEISNEKLVFKHFIGGFYHLLRRVKRAPIDHSSYTEYNF